MNVRAEKASRGVLECVLITEGGNVSANRPKERKRGKEEKTHTHTHRGKGKGKRRRKKKNTNNPARAWPAFTRNLPHRRRAEPSPPSPRRDARFRRDAYFETYFREPRGIPSSAPRGVLTWSRTKKDFLVRFHGRRGITERVVSNYSRPLKGRLQATITARILLPREACRVRLETRLAAPTVDNNRCERKVFSSQRCVNSSERGIDDGATRRGGEPTGERNSIIITIFPEVHSGYTGVTNCTREPHQTFARLYADACIPRIFVQQGLCVVSRREVPRYRTFCAHVRHPSTLAPFHCTLLQRRVHRHTHVHVRVPRIEQRGRCARTVVDTIRVYRR